MRLFTLILAALLSLAALPALAERRVALVIGNDSYKEVMPLQKAVNDAESIASNLTRLGFEVTSITDADRRSMNRYIEEFAAQLEEGDVALMFYAGHGVEIDGENYLLPVDIPQVDLSQANYLKTESIGLSHALDRLRSSGARISLAIVDACRENPFSLGNTRSLGRTRGLGRIAAPEGTFVIFSAGAGQLALDRLHDSDPDPNSVFTRSLIPLLERPGLGVRALAVELRRDVRRLAMSVAHPQTPAYYDELIGEFHFSPEAQANLVLAPAPDQESPIKADFTLVKEIGTDAAWRAFLARHGHEDDDFHVVLARSALAQLTTGQEVTIDDTAREVEVPAAHDCDYLAGHPEDPGGTTEGVYYTSIAPREAIAACRRATDAYPATPRFAFQLGRAYRVEEDFEAARIWYNRAIDMGYPMAMSTLAYLHRDGQGVPQDYSEAIRWHTQAADKGLPIAMHELAKMHARGQGVPQDFAKAMDWYRMAAELDHPWSFYSIGRLYEDGEGVEQDYTEALKWFRQAADFGISPALNRIGFYYAKGQGVEKDFQEAMRWYRKAVDAGDVWAIKNMGELFERGNGVEKNTDEAAKWYATALSSGHAYTLERMTTQPEKFEEGTRKAIQTMLRDGGYYTGAIDGDFGPATIAALEDFYNEGAKPGAN